MKTTAYKYLLVIAGILITGTGMAQSIQKTVVPFKDIQVKQLTDNFTAREIKKKELAITPSQIVLLNIPGNQLSKGKYREKKKNVRNN